MHSIKMKLFFLIFGSMLGLFALMFFVGSNILNETVEEDNSTAMRLIVDNKAEDLNDAFNRVERADKVLAAYIRDNIDTNKLRTDSEYEESFYDQITGKCETAGLVAGNVIAVYFRLDPDEYGSTAGIFMTDNGNDELVRVEPTDIFKYAKTDREYVGWYYEPVENGSPMWVLPYHNKNINMYMMSYVIPIYEDNSLIGVVGMDIKMSSVSSVLDSVNYKNGFAYLLDSEGDILYHRDYPEGVSMKRFNSDMKAAAKFLTPQMSEKDQINKCVWKDEPHRIISRNLNNGMVIALSVPEQEIIRPERLMQLRMAVIFVVAILAVLIVFLRLLVVIVLPIKELTRASSRIAKGELNTTIKYKSNDEIGTLAKSVSKMAMEIKDYFTYIHSQAYTDAMTGVGNKAAYMDVVKLMDRKISEGMAAFIVVVFDVNGLKSVNDNLGHEYGDMLITDAADIMKHVFSAENVFRIGGDEFIVVIENEGVEEIDSYFKSFDEELKSFNENNGRYEHDLAVSKGGVPYDKDSDKAYKDVFKRADDMMYRDKERYYSGRNDRRKGR